MSLLIDGVFPQTLTEIKLNSCGLRDKGTCDLCDLLRGNRKVRVLRLWNNGIGDKGATYIAQMLLTNRGVDELNLGNNRIKNEGARALAGALRINPKVKKIGLLWNPMSIAEREKIEVLMEMPAEQRTAGRARDEEKHEIRAILQEVEDAQKKEDRYEELLQDHQERTRQKEMKKEAEEEALDSFQIRHFGYWAPDAKLPAFVMFCGMNYHIAPRLWWGKTPKDDQGESPPNDSAEERELKLRSFEGVEWDGSDPELRFELSIDELDPVAGVVCDPKTGILNCCRSKPLKPHFIVITAYRTLAYLSDGSDGSKAGTKKSVTVERTCTPFGIEFMHFSDCPPKMMRDVLLGYGLGAFLAKRYSKLQREMALMAIKRQAPVVQNWKAELGDIT